MSNKVTVKLSSDTSELNSGLNRAQKKLKEFQSDGEKGFQNLGGRIKSAFTDNLSGIFVGVAGIAALKGAVDHFGELNDRAVALGESAEVVQRVGQVAKEAGGSLDGVASAMLRMEKNLGDIENVKAAEVLQRFGVTAESLAKLPLDEKMVAFAEAFQKARKEGTGVADMQALLGKGAVELIPLMNLTGEELRNAFAGVDVLTQTQVDSLDLLGDRLDRLGQQAQTTAGRVVSSMAGIGGAVQAWLSDRIAASMGGGDGGYLSKYMERLGAEEQASIARLQQRRKEAAEAPKRLAESQAAAIGADTEKKKADFAYAQLSTQEKLAQVYERIATINTKAESGALNADPVAKAKAQADLNELLREEVKLKKEAAEAALKAAEGQKKLDIARAEFKLQADITAQLVISGGIENDRIRSMQDEVAILEMTQQLRDQLGVSEADALKMAEARVKLEREATKAAEDGARAKKLQETMQQAAVNHERASGRNRRADRMEREMEVARQQKELQELGMSPEEAAKRAEAMQRDSDKIAGKRTVIRGHTNSQGAVRGFEGLDGRSFPGLDAMHQQRGTSLRADWQFPGLDGLARSQVRANTQRAEEAKQGSGAENLLKTMTGLLEKIEQKLEIAA